MFSVAFCFDMGRNSHITSIKRAQILTLYSEGKKQRQIARSLNLSVCAVHNAINHVISTGSFENQK